MSKPKKKTAAPAPTVNEPIQKRWGRFSISSGFLNSRPFEVRSIMSRCLIYRAQLNNETDSVEYFAESDMFELWEWAEGAAVPAYTIMLSSIGPTAKREEPTDAAQ